MGWVNPPVPWRELEQNLSGRARRDHSASNPLADSAPGYSRKRPAYVPDDQAVRRPDGPVVPYAELHCHSNFSFLDGVSDPEELIEEAVRLGLEAIAITDHDGFYAASRFAEAALAYDLRTIYGAELSLNLTTPQNGVADPEGQHLLVLARGVGGYHRLAGAITEAQLRGDEKGRPVYDLEELAAAAGDQWLILTGCRKGSVRQALIDSDVEAAARELDQLTALFGHDHVVVELIDHGLPGDSRMNDALAMLADDHGLPMVASNNVHFATPKDGRLGDAVAAVRARRSLADMDGWLSGPGAHLRSGTEMAQLFARFPGVVRRTVEIADDCAFNLRLAKPRLPKQRVPLGHTPNSWLRELCRKGADERYAHIREVAEERLQKELQVIIEKDFGGYFLIVHDMVKFARGRGILCQGRGSAANSAVCYVLGVTAVDPIKYDLPFERFLSTTREEEPDIDVDFDSDRREEVIQEVYRVYGRRNAAQVANVISYRPKSAVRDMAKALGYSTGQQDAWSKQLDSYSQMVSGDTGNDHGIPETVLELAEQLLKAPRHLGIHSGGMVLTERPVGEVCPIERGRMENRTVLQWDKDSCAWMGLVKFDFLGLGILAAIQYTFDLVADRIGERWGLDTMPKEEAGVYDMLCRADSIGVFQVESRAQVGTLPRLQPRRFYDLVIEIALIRPGPIQGGAVHPYIRRATGKEEVEYLHPALRPVLERTKGVPLFQEQLMQIAMAVGDCTGDDADLLRRAMGSKRGVEKIERLKDKLYRGMARHGIVGELADDIYLRIQAFANFGFAESHAISFALLVYASSWLKLHYPGAFLAGLLRAQPMGFYSPQSLVADARRHGVKILRPDIGQSVVYADLEPLSGGRSPEPPPQSVKPRLQPVNGLEPTASDSAPRAQGIDAQHLDPQSSATGMDSCLLRDQPDVPPFIRSAPDLVLEHRRDGNFAVRLGLTEVQGVGQEVAERIVTERNRQPFSSMNDVVRRTRLTVPQTEALATAGAFDCFGLSRRQALWNAGYTDNDQTLPGSAIDAAPPTLPGMSEVDLTLADLSATKISPDEHPIAHLRSILDDHDIVRIGDLGPAYAERRIKVAGLITHRQRPSTAGGVTFLNVEDETGMLNVVCSHPLWLRFGRVGRNAQGMVIRGRIEYAEGVTNLVAERLQPLAAVLPQTRSMLPPGHRSRDFR